MFLLPLNESHYYAIFVSVVDVVDIVDLDFVDILFGQFETVFE